MKFDPGDEVDVRNYHEPGAPWARATIVKFWWGTGTYEVRPLYGGYPNLFIPTAEVHPYTKGVPANTT